MSAYDDMLVSEVRFVRIGHRLNTLAAELDSCPTTFRGRRKAKRIQTEIRVAAAHATTIGGQLIAARRAVHSTAGTM